MGDDWGYPYDETETPMEWATKPSDKEGYTQSCVPPRRKRHRFRRSLPELCLHSHHFQISDHFWNFCIQNCCLIRSIMVNKTWAGTENLSRSQRLGMEDTATSTWARKVHRKLHQVPGNQLGCRNIAFFVPIFFEWM